MSTVNFEVRKNSIEISYKNRMEITEGCTVNQDDKESEIIKQFDKKDDALIELQNYKTEIKELSGGSGKYYLVTEYYVEENTYDEDGEWESGGDVWEFSKIQIEVTEKPSYDTFGTYNNFKDAEKKLDGLDDGFLSF